MPRSVGSIVENTEKNNGNRRILLTNRNFAAGIQNRQKTLSRKEVVTVKIALMAAFTFTLA